MGKKPATLAAFDVGAAYLKFVEMPLDERRVITAGVFPLAPGRWLDRDHLAAQVRSALDTTARGRVARLIASVPLGHAHLRATAAPGGDAATARGHGVWDMGQYLARPLDDYLTDAWPQPAPGPVVTAAFRRGPAETFRAAVEAGADRPLDALDVDVAGIVNAYAANYPERAGLPAVLVQANVAGTAVVRVRGGLLEDVVFLRNDDVPPVPGTDSQELAESLLGVAKGLGARLRDSGDDRGEPDPVFLCGDFAANADFRELLHAHLGVPYGLLNPFRNIPGPDPDEFPDVYPGAPLTAATGLALRLAEEP